MKTPEEIIGQTVSRLLPLSLEEYLASKNFLQFCRQNDLGDAWSEALRRSQDRPDLYGRSVIKKAFELFLLHILHNRKEEFAGLFSSFLTGFSQEISCPLPLDELKRDLAELTGNAVQLPG